MGKSGQRILVTGGTSNVGAEVALALHAQGHEVTTVALPGLPSTHLDQHRIPLIYADVTDQEAMVRLFDGQDAVVHCAASLSFYSSARAHTFKVNVDGTRSCVRAARRADVKRFFHMSSVAVYGRLHGRERVNEATPTLPSGLAYNDSKRDAEAVIYAEAGAMRATILRLTTVYGRFDRLLIPTVVDAFQKGRGYFLGDPTRPMALVSSSYVAQAVLRLLSRPAIAPVEKFIVSESEPPTHQQFLEAIAGALHVAGPTRRVPSPMVLLYGRICDAAQRLGLKPAFSLPHAEAANALVDAIFDGSALRERLALPIVDSLAGVREAVRGLSRRQLGALALAA